MEFPSRFPADFKVVPIDRDAMKVEPYLNHQPFGQMPYLVDQENGLELFESRAICKCKRFSPQPSSRD